MPLCTLTRNLPAGDLIDRGGKAGTLCLLLCILKLKIAQFREDF